MTLFANVEELHASLAREDPSFFFSRFLLEGVPHLFGGDIASWIEWKHELGQLLEVDPRDISLIGSASLGWSLNPKKNFSQFHEGSDIDCAIVSGHHFDLAWRHLRQQRVQWLSVSRRTKTAIESHRQNLIFAGTIATDQMLSILPFGQAWQRALDQIAARTPGTPRELKLRIYRDYDALRYYHASNIRQIRDSQKPSDSDDISIDREC